MTAEAGAAGAGRSVGTEGIQTLCMTCEGRGDVAVLRRTLHGTAHVIETCRTCKGRRFYDWNKGPGVDPDGPHGSGTK